MRYVVLVALGLAIAVGAAAACSSFEDGNAPGAVDAGRDVATAPSPDSGDAGAAGDGDAATPPFCGADAGTLCEDFDDPKSGVLPFTLVDPGAAFEVVPDRHVSSPNGLRITVARPGAGDSCRYAIRYATTDVPAPNGARAEYKLRPTSLGNAANVGVALELSNVNASEKCTLYLQHYPDGARLFVTREGGFPPGEVLLTRKAPLDSWTSIAIDVTGVPGARSTTVTFDGVVAGKDSVMTYCQGGTRITKVEVAARCVADTAGADLDVAVDDVRVIAH